MTSAPTLGHIATHIEGCEGQNLVAQGRGAPAVAELESLLSSKGTYDILKQSNPYEILSVVESRLDLRSHQVGCLFLLDHVCLNHASELLKGKGGDTLLFSDFIRVGCAFLSSCRQDDYIGYSHVSQKRLGSLCAELGKLAMACEIPKRVIEPLFSGLQCMVNGRFERITPVSQLLLQACVKAKFYGMARTLLASHRATLTLYEPRVYKTTESDLLLYFYSAGLVYTGLKEYEKAFDMYLGALVIPRLHLNDVAVDASKKYILISLILHGSLTQLPNFAPNVIKRNIFSECEGYMELVEQIKALNESGTSGAKELEDFITSRNGTWEADGNIGLVNILLHMQKERILRRLGAVYTCIPKALVASELGLEGSSVDELLLTCGGAYHARIDDALDVVYLEKRESVKMKDLIGLIQECLAMKQAIDEDSHKIQCSPAFILQQETHKMASTSLK